MEKAKLRERVLIDLEKLISQSCKNPTDSKKNQQLHSTLLKKYYNATNVTIDYHRHRIYMEVIQDDSTYDPQTVNTNLPIIYTNLLFKSLHTFLKTCVDKDTKSIGFYAHLLKAYGATNSRLKMA